MTSVFLFLASIAAAAMGTWIFMSTDTSIHELSGFVAFLIAAVCFVGSAILDKMDDLRDLASGSQRLAEPAPQESREVDGSSSLSEPVERERLSDRDPWP